MGNVKIVNSKLLGGAMPLDVTSPEINQIFTKRKEIHVRTHLAEPVYGRFTQYENGVICTLWGYHLRVSRHVSPREAHLLARFAETKLLNDIWTHLKDGVLWDEIHGRFRNKLLYNIFLL